MLAFYFVLEEVANKTASIYFTKLYFANLGHFKLDLLFPLKTPLIVYNSFEVTATYFAPPY
jgi:hypothetical protein